MPKAPRKLDWKGETEGNGMLSLKRQWDQFAKIINGLLSFGDGVNADNISGQWINVTTPGVANTDFTISHGLNRLPVGYIVVQKNVAADLYTGGSAATATTITWRCSVASAVLRIFLI